MMRTAVATGVGLSAMVTVWAALVGLYGGLGWNVPTSRGDGDQSAAPFWLSAGTHRVTWDAACPLDVELWRYEPQDRLAQLGNTPGRVVIAEPGRYFASVGAACGWTVRVSPT